MNILLRQMVLIMLIGLIAFSACSGGGGGDSSNNEDNGDNSTDEYYSLNLSSQNKIMHGKDIYDAVINKYADMGRGGFDYSV
jgi:hypothetical protein